MGGRTGWDYGLPYTELVDRGDYKITGLHPVFGALDFYNRIFILYILLNIYYYVYIYLFIYILINIHILFCEKLLVLFYF